MNMCMTSLTDDVIGQWYQLRFVLVIDIILSYLDKKKHIFNTVNDILS